MMDERDMQRFVDAVGSSIEVSTHQRMFSWLHSSAQALVPHEILLCGVRDGAGQAITLHRFCATRYFRDEHFEALSHPQSGLAATALEIAVSLKNSTIVCYPELTHPAFATMQALVADNELKNLAVRLIEGVSGQFDAIYAFARVGPVPAQRVGAMLEILAPHIHAAFLRVLAAERESRKVVGQEAEQLITRRQVQILNLVKVGKTNAEIADLLGCSQWTIKNHIHSILKRLDSTSRTHAISRAMSLRILTPD